MENLHKVEIVIIALFILAQLFIFIRVCKKIKLFKLLFANQIGVETDDELNKPSVVVYGSNGKIISDAPIQDAVDNINVYLDHNWGSAMNFSIIENILERELETKDEEISHQIPTPLYLGLAATMTGIILGLWSMGNLTDSNKDNVQDSTIQDNFEEKKTTENTILFEDAMSIKSEGTKELVSAYDKGIDNLITGVKIAMIASLVGLLCTTLLSTIIYKRAKNKVNEAKNSKLNFLQAALLLPTEDHTLDGIKITIEDFKQTIGHSITELSGLAIQNKGIAQSIKDSTESQFRILNQIQEMKPAKVANVLANLFDRVDANMEAYREFSQYLDLMRNIASNLASFSNRTKDMETIAAQIKDNLNESRELSLFLSQHVRGIENIGEQSMNAINLADSHFRSAIDQLDLEIAARIATLKDGSNAFDTKITEIFNEVGRKLQEITEHHVKEITNAYHDSLPEFKRLEKLDNLDDINTKLDATQYLGQLDDMNVKLDGMVDLERIAQGQTDQLRSMNTPLASIKANQENETKQILDAIGKMNERLDRIERNTGKLKIRDPWYIRLFRRKKKEPAKAETTVEKNAPKEKKK